MEWPLKIGQKRTVYETAALQLSYTLESEQKGNSRRDVVLMLGLALMENSDSVAIWEIDALLFVR